ncbi:Tn3 family transposase [Erwinia sp. 198]|uniref:Tn3 family transposase n=1 Tax=Erwinia sp. 198 TaxID=2022746 RepID=UPI003513804C
MSICVMLTAEASNTGSEPFIRNDVAALKRDRLIWTDDNYIRDETIRAANAILVAAQTGAPLTNTWGGGEVVSADGMRDSLVILADVPEQQTDQMPYQIMTDTGAYGDVIFGLFRLLGYRFCPRIADTGGAQILKRITVHLTRYLRTVSILGKNRAAPG